MGIIKEKDLKEYVYSPYGKDLIRNQRLGLTLLTFLTKTPVAEIRTEIEQILEICTLDKNCEAVIVTENGRYIGLLNMSALLNLINEKNLAIARDQNPLTKLPGNTIINAFLARVVPNGKVSQMFVYFDFDNFKPFNDKYGFRRGDRAILLFADMLKMLSHRHGMFVGHIGGDDFFSSVQFQNGQAKPFLEIIKSTLRKFREDVVNLYDDDDKRAGYIMDRNQEERWVRIPLLTVSAAVLIKDMEEEPFSIEELAQSMAKVKKKAKESIDKLSILYLGRRSGTAEREDPAPPTPSFSLNTEYYLRMSAG
jgi:diguanylate cyclase (GGDEF)-like protein